MLAVGVYFVFDEIKEKCFGDESTTNGSAEQVIQQQQSVAGGGSEYGTTLTE